MSRLRPEKLHVTFATGTGPDGPVLPRAYTLTHSDLTGDLFLTVGPEHNQRQIRGLYTRLMRDEVLAEWAQPKGRLGLHVHCHVSGGLLTLGPAPLRLAIFRRELPLALEALRFGDRRFFGAHPACDRRPVQVHFEAHRPRFDRIEEWGVPGDYSLAERNRES